LDLKFIKIGSGDTNNIKMMRYIAKQNVPLIVSTGMQTDATVTKVRDIFSDAVANFALLHCVSSYPTQAEDVKLNYITRYRQQFPDTPIGYSGHEQGIEISCLAVLMGARILERHFTLDKHQKGSDHCLSLDPSELRALVERVRLIERNVNGSSVIPNDLLRSTVTELNLFECPEGLVEKACQPDDDSPKSISACELPCKHKLGKSLVYARDASKGDRLTEGDVDVKVSEPNGIPAEFYDDVVGRVLMRDVLHDEPVIECDINRRC
jgi:sialic acid synthase